MDKDTVIHSLKLFGQLIIVSILNIFICISFMFICTAAFTKDIGYSAVVFDKDNMRLTGMSTIQPTARIQSLPNTRRLTDIRFQNSR